MRLNSEESIRRGAEIRQHYASWQEVRAEIARRTQSAQGAADDAHHLAEARGRR